MLTEPVSTDEPNVDRSDPSPVKEFRDIREDATAGPAIDVVPPKQTESWTVKNPPILPAPSMEKQVAPEILPPTDTEPPEVVESTIAIEEPNRVGPSTEKRFFTIESLLTKQPSDIPQLPYVDKPL
jgi:hypothetical protein